MVQGYVGIAALIAGIWNIPVSPKTAWKYAARNVDDPLPVEHSNGRVYAFEEHVRKWAEKRIGWKRSKRH